MQYQATMSEREIREAISAHVKGKPGFEHGARVSLASVPGDRPGEPDEITAHLTALPYTQGKD